VEPVNKLPGLTFHVETAQLTNKLGKAEIHADVNDVDMWEQVITKLDGLRIYTVEDLATSVMEVLQTENKEEKMAHARQTEELRQQLETLKQRNSFLEQQNAEYARVNALWIQRYGGQT
jgi:gamma-glutamylcyclotransferase (GGCT)/AIG2-like uncharacterized protein YtfP